MNKLVFSIGFIYLMFMVLPNLKSQVIFEAEDAYYSNGEVATEHQGYTGDGFVDTENNLDEYIEWKINLPKPISDTLGFRYALGKDEVRSMQVVVNETIADTIDFGNTTEFTNYTYKFLKASLNAGENTIKLVSLTAEGAPNMDHMTVNIDTNLYFRLNYTINGEGTVTVSPTADSILYGTRVMLEAEANTGNIFTNWTGDKETSRNPVKFTLDKDYQLTANFVNSLPAFPGAEGFASNVTGGRGGQVIAVTNLNDSGDGSLRAAISASGPRTIVFKVSGTIHLESNLSINNNDVTIAGQTAPGGGITLAHYPLKVSADNVIIRFIRSRLGDAEGVQDDAMNGRHNNGVIIDHCTMSWSVDETASFYDNSNFTMQYCLVSESLYKSIHEKGPHGYGGIWGGQGVSFHHNLIAHHVSRNPRFCGSRYTNEANLEKVDFRNNVIFNWGFNSIYGAEGGSYNMVNNYYKPGPATRRTVRRRIIAPDPSDGSNNQPAGIWGTFYVNGNYVEEGGDVNDDNWQGVHFDGTTEDNIKSEVEFDFAEVQTHSAFIAFEHVLAQAGAILPSRDTIDKRIVQEVITGEANYGGYFGDNSGIIDAQNMVGGWPELEPGNAHTDSDEDGMPDDWENQNGLDPNNPDDGNEDANSDGYTNLEDYLNGLVEAYTYIIRPVNLNISVKNSSKVELTWEDVTTNESGFLLERQKNDEPFVQIAKLSENTKTYTDTDIQEATYAYRLRSFNDRDTSYYTDTVLCSFSTSINQATPTGSISVYPNPFKNSCIIDFGEHAASTIQVKLFDFGGREIAIPKKAEKCKVVVNTHRLTSGVYLLVVKTMDNIFSKRIIKL